MTSPSTPSSSGLPESEDRLQAILDNTTAVIYMKDPAGRYLLVNRWFEKLFHVTRSSIAGKTDFDIFPANVATAFRVNDQMVFERQEAIEFEEVATHDDGPHTYISMKFPLFDTAGGVYAVCGVSTDITERKRAQQAIEEMNAELERRVGERTAEVKNAYDALEKANEALREVDRMKSAFIDLTSHELTTPVMVVTGMLSLLEGKLADADPALRQTLQAAVRSARRLERLILRSLKLAGRGEYEREFRTRETRVEELVRDVATEALPFLAERKLRFSVNISEGLPAVPMDRGKIHDALVNLVLNAIKFTPEGGSVEIDARLVEPPGVEIRVADTGVGVPEADIPHLFDQFFAGLDTTHHSSGDWGFDKRGAGLGLAIVKMFVEMHGGRVGVESTAGKGSSFHITLPLA